MGNKSATTRSALRDAPGQADSPSPPLGAPALNCDSACDRQRPQFKGTKTSTVLWMDFPPRGAKGEEALVCGGDASGSLPAGLGGPRGRV